MSCDAGFPVSPFAASPKCKKQSPSGIVLETMPRRPASRTRLCRTAVGYFGYFHLARHAPVPGAGRGALKALRARISFHYSGSSSGCSEFPRIATNTLLAQTLAASRTRCLGHARAVKTILCGALVRGFSHTVIYIYIYIYIYCEAVSAPSYIHSV